MSLNVSKLEKVRELAGGVVQARCPACAEGGHDRTGEHLRIYPDGRFGCCVHPKDGEHRRRIFALAGDKKPGTFTLRIKTPPAMTAGRSVKAGLVAAPSQPLVESRTPRTGNSESRARAREDVPSSLDMGMDSQGELKELESGVRAVRGSLPVGSERLPFLTADGTLSIPFDSPARYHWWTGGQSVAATIAEVKERMNHAATV